MLPSLAPATLGRSIHIVINGACCSALILNIVRDNAYHPRRFIDTPPPPAVYPMIWSPDGSITNLNRTVPFHPHADKIDGTWHFIHHLNPAGTDATDQTETPPLRGTAS